MSVCLLCACSYAGVSCLRLLRTVGLMATGVPSCMRLRACVHRACALPRAANDRLPSADTPPHAWSPGRPCCSCFYLTRNSLTYTAPAMVADPTLGIGLAEIGTMTSIFPIGEAGHADHQ